MTLPMLTWGSGGRQVDGMFPVGAFLAERLGLAGDKNSEHSLCEVLIDYVGKFYERKCFKMLILYSIAFQLFRKNIYVNFKKISML